MIFLRNNFLKEYCQDNNLLQRDELYNKFASDFEFNNWISDRDNIKVTSCDDKLIIISNNTVYEITPKLNKQAIQEGCTQPWWMEDIDPWSLAINQDPETNELYQIRQYPFMSQTSRGQYPYVDISSPEEHLHEVKWLSTSKELNITKGAEPHFKDNYIIAELPNEMKEILLHYSFLTIYPEFLYKKEEFQGRTINPHITILSNVLEDKDTSLNKITKPISCKIGELKKFSKDGYDVIYVECLSEALNNLRNTLKKELKNEDKFNENIFHITLAYVFPGTCDVFLGEFQCTGMPFDISQILYSDKQDIRYFKDIPVENKKEESLNMIHEDNTGAYFWGDENTGFSPQFDMHVE